MKWTCIPKIILGLIVNIVHVVLVLEAVSFRKLSVLDVESLGIVQL